MKISRDKLKQIICEEIEAAVKERFVVNETRHIGSAVYQSNRPYDRSLESPIKASGFPTLIHVGQSLALVRRELLKIYGPLQDRIKDINGQQQGIFADREIAARLIKASRDIKRTIEIINPEIAKFKNLGEQFKGSYNQRLIDLNKMFKSIDKMIKDLGVRENGDEDKETVIEGVNGYMVKIGSSEELAKKMIWFIENKDKIPLMGKESRIIAERKFDVRKVNKDMLRILGI